MDNDPLWPFFVIAHVGGIVVGVALASLWWRQHCSHLATAEAQRRRDRRERIERLTAPAEPGGKTRDRAATVGDVLAHVHRTGHVPPVDAGGRPLPPIPPPGQPEPSGGRPPLNGDWYLTKEVPEDRRR
jgi:hypothetical protein